MIGKATISEASQAPTCRRCRRQARPCGKWEGENKTNNGKCRLKYPVFSWIFQLMRLLEASRATQNMCMGLVPSFGAQKGGSTLCRWQRSDYGIPWGTRCSHLSGAVRTKVGSYDQCRPRVASRELAQLLDNGVLGTAEKYDGTSKICERAKVEKEGPERCARTRQTPQTLSTPLLA